MGVSGLFETLKPITQDISISDLAGMTVGIDGYGWLHRATMACANDLLEGKPTTRYIEYFERQINMMQMHNINPYFVFDGDDLPIKARINASRETRRSAARAEFRANPCLGNAKRALNVTTAMAASVCALLKTRRIPYVVAPFEADAQLVYLEQNNIIDAILSEDSDLVVFGARRLVSKYKDSSAKLVDLRRLNELPLYRGFCGGYGSSDDEDSSSDLSTRAFLRALAILSGCDYSAGCFGFGVSKAAKLLRRCGGSLEAALMCVDASPDFKNEANIAGLCFQYQRVWDPRQKQLDTLNAIPDLEALKAEAMTLLGQDDNMGDTDKPRSTEKPGDSVSKPLTSLDQIIGHQKHNFRKSLGMLCPQTGKVFVLDPTVTLYIAQAKRPRLVPIKQPDYSNRAKRFLSSPQATQKSPFFMNLATPASITAKPAPGASCGSSGSSGSPNPRTHPAILATPSTPRNKENVPFEKDPHSSPDCPPPAVPAMRASSIPSPESSPIRAHTTNTLDDSIVMGNKRFKIGSAATNRSSEPSTSQSGSPPKLDLSRFMYTK